MDPKVRMELRNLLEGVESAGCIGDDSQQDIREAQNEAVRDEVRALKALVIALTKAALHGS